MRHLPPSTLVAGALLSLGLAACKPVESPQSAPSLQAPTASSTPAPEVDNSTKLSPVAQVGAKLFFDISLSGSGKMSCASCHDPQHAYAPANDLSVQLGGLDGTQSGTRAVPSLMYKEYTNPYSDTFENPDMISPPGPGGGMTWDGRANTMAEQAAIPLLAPNEMAAASKAFVVEAVLKGAHAQEFRKVFGIAAENTDKAFDAVGEALQAFQMEDPSFHPYSSKFDLYRHNKRGGAFSDAEIRGLRVFVDPNKGNCVACHLIGGGNNGSQDMTSDYSFSAIGVPRNKNIPANADDNYFDLGLCGPLRTDHDPRKTKDNKATCGMFKTPILRNVATRQTFMHNGYFKSLEDVVSFYNTRDTQPEKWYPKDSHGGVLKFDDLPAKYRSNIDTQMPLDLRRPGSKSPMTDDEVQDLITFLKTLTDGYIPDAQAAGHQVSNAVKDLAAKP